MQTYFTHFAYDELATKLENEERAAKVRSGKAQREEILQEEVDRFIFMEGMYPITHCEASGGKLDTLIELYNDANRRRHRPLLLELKQALNLLHSEEITVEAVAAAINDGLDQAELYRKHVRTNTRWSDVDPFVVVFHNCTERIDDDESRNVVLVSLSELTPSGSRRRRRRFTSSTG